MNEDSCILMAMLFRLQIGPGLEELAGIKNFGCLAALLIPLTL